MRDEGYDGCVWGRGGGLDSVRLGRTLVATNTTIFCDTL